MEHSSSQNFSPILDPQNANQQHYQGRQGLMPSQYPTHFAPHHYGPNFQQQYTPNMPQLSIPSNFNQFPHPHIPASFNGAPYAEGRQFTPSPGFIGAGRGSGSNGDESASPNSATPQLQPVHNVEDESSDGASPEEDARARQNWTDEENVRLANAWLSNSNDPIDGNAKKSAQYWKQVTDEYNNNSPRDEKRTLSQLKSHWSKGNKLVVQFNGCHHELKKVYQSGQSEDMLIQKTYAKWKSDYKAKHAFPLEPWWRTVKEEAKWCRVYPLKVSNKRTKLSASGAYTSSSTQGSEEGFVEAARPGGRKGAKAKRKGKEKVSENSLLIETCDKFNELAAAKSAAIITMAEATKESAAAKKEMAIATKENATAKKEMAKAEKMKQYVKLVTHDTSNYTEAQLERHEKAMAYFTSELFDED